MLFAFHLLWINDLQNADKKITELELHISKEKLPQITIPIIYGGTKALRAEYFSRLGRKDLALSIAKSLDSKDIAHFARVIYADMGMAHEAVQIMREYLKTDQYYYSYYELLHSVFYERIRNDPEFQHLLIERKPIYDDMVRKYRIK